MSSHLQTWKKTGTLFDPHDERWVKMMIERVQLGIRDYKNGAQRRFPRLYSRDLVKINDLEFEELFQLHFYRQVKRYESDDCLASLVWCGWDYERMSAQKPVVFELALSKPSSPQIDGSVWRYSSEEQALEAWPKILRDFAGVPSQEQISLVVKSLKGML